MYCTGKFFEVLIGRRTEPLLTLLSKIAVLYTLEPIFTVVYVINMTTIWERVMASLRGQIFRRMLIQKVQIICKHLQNIPFETEVSLGSAYSIFIISWCVFVPVTHLQYVIEGWGSNCMLDSYYLKMYVCCVHAR